MNWPAFDFLEVDAVTGERFEGSEERARFVSKAQSDGHFVGFGRSEVRRHLRWNKQNKTGEVFRIVVDVFGEDDAAINCGSAARSDSGEGFVAARHDFADTAGCILGGNSF